MVTFLTKQEVQVHTFKLFLGLPICITIKVSRRVNRTKGQMVHSLVFGKEINKESSSLAEMKLNPILRNVCSGPFVVFIHSNSYVLLLTCSS